MTAAALQRVLFDKCSVVAMVVQSIFSGTFSIVFRVFSTLWSMVKLVFLPIHYVFLCLFNSVQLLFYHQIGGFDLVKRMFSSTFSVAWSTFKLGVLLIQRVLLSLPKRFELVQRLFCKTFSVMFQTLLALWSIVGCVVFRVQHMCVGFLSLVWMMFYRPTGAKPPAPVMVAKNLNLGATDVVNKVTFATQVARDTRRRRAASACETSHAEDDEVKLSWRKRCSCCLSNSNTYCLDGG